MTEDVTNYGAVGDGSTDDTEAIRRTADAAAPDGTVYFPSGTYLVGTTDRLPLDYPNDGSWDDLTWEGERWDTTKIKLAGGQSDFHNILHVDTDERSTVTGVTVKQLTLDVNGSNQSHRVGMAVQINNTTGRSTFTDCHVLDATTNGIGAQSGDVTVEHCRATDTAKGAKQLTGNAGHFIAVGTSGTVTARHCDNVNNHGSFVDIGTGAAATVTVEDCRMDGRKAQTSNLAKINPGGSSLTIRRTYAENIEYFGIYSTPQSSSLGSITLDNVEFDDVDRSGIDLPAPADISLNEVQLSNVDLEPFRGPHAIWVKGDSSSNAVDFQSSGRIGVHNVGPSGGGEVIRAVNSAGSIREAVRDGTTGGLGDPGEVTVSSTTTDGPISPTYPSPSEVGPRSPGSDPDPEPEPEPEPGGVIQTNSAGVIRTDGVGRILVGGSRSQPSTALIDSFEGDLSAWSGASSRYSVVDASTTPMSPADGSQVLEIEGDGGTGSIYSLAGDGLANYFSKGTAARIYFCSEYGGSWRFHFGYSDANNYYDARAEFGSGKLHLSRNGGGGYGNLDSASQQLDRGSLYYVDVTWDDGTLGGADDDITLEWYDGSGTLLRTLSVNDSMHASADGVGIRGYGNRKPMYVDYLHLTRGV